MAEGSAGPDPWAAAVAELAARRRAVKMTQRELAAAIGTAQSSISDIEAGRVQPRYGTLARMAEALQADLRVVVVPRNTPGKRPEAKKTG